MAYRIKSITAWQAQCIAWLVVMALLFFSNLQNDSAGQAIVFAVIATAYYAAIIYANASWLMPRFYYKKKYALYVVLLVVTIAVIIVGRTLLSMGIYNTYFAVKKEPLTRRAFTYGLVSASFILIFSYFFRLALNFFTLSKKQAEIKAEKSQTELTLLKQQLHPHFLFNTLNNIYYVAGKDSPEAASLIERLSSIMRYFIEEAKKDKVFLKDEIALLESYISLENIRMRYQMPVNFAVNGNISGIIVPPLLLMPMVENIFKHGVDKRSKDNYADISLSVKDGHLLFSTKNICYPSAVAASSKTGLANLEKRLQLYYQNNYQLTAKQQGNDFVAVLQIPVDEN